MTDETVEAVARVIELAIVRHGVEEAALEGTLDDAVSAITAYEASRTDVEELREALSTVSATLGFFVSVIKCGEPWTATCEANWVTVREAMSLLLTRISSLEAMVEEPTRK